VDVVVVVVVDVEPLLQLNQEVVQVFLPLVRAQVSISEECAIVWSWWRFPYGFL